MPEIKQEEGAPPRGLPDRAGTAEPAGVAVGSYLRWQAAAWSLGGGACTEQGHATWRHGGITARVPGEAAAAGSQHHQITALGRRNSRGCDMTCRTLSMPIAHGSGPGGQDVPAPTTVNGHVHS
jgi:hypothetical protein